ncbi:MAG: hypothetical protein ACKVW3_06480 [Phycisphaerales bacterium]
MNRTVSRLVGTVVVAASILGLSDPACAAARPHKSSGTAQFVSPTEFVGAGRATHLGNYSEAGTVAFTPTGNPAVLNVVGTITYTASDGSELHAAVAGELNGATGAVSATVTYTGGTGRFADATGSSCLTGQVQPDGSMTVAVRGTIDY